MSRPIPQEMDFAIWFWEMLQQDDPHRAELVQIFTDPIRWGRAVRWAASVYDWEERGW